MMLSRKGDCHTGVEDVEALLSSDVQRLHEQQRPRTARVNTLKMSVATALAWLSSPPPEHSSHAYEVLLLTPACFPHAFYGKSMLHLMILWQKQQPGSPQLPPSTAAMLMQCFSILALHVPP